MKSHEESKRQNGQKTEHGKKGGEKWSKSLIDKLRSYRSLRRHPFLFFPPKRGDQPAILPVVRPAVFLVFENDRDGSFVRLEAGVEVTCIPWQRSLGNPSQRVDASRTTKGGADFSRNLGEQQPFSPRVKETNFLPSNFHEPSPTQGSLIFHREDPDAFKYGG